jgi:hypothetical protein
MWLHELKKALLLQDLSKLDEILSSTPKFDNNEHIEEAVYLLHAVRELLEKERNSSLCTMNQLKNTLDFLKANETSPQSSFNLKL